MVTVKGLTFSYTSNNAIQFPDFSLGKGEHCLLLGDSGSGKTTLLHILGGLLRNYQGEVKIENTELSSLSETDLDRFRGSKLGFVFQKNHLIAALTVERNLQMVPYLSGVKIDQERISHVLQHLGIANKNKSKVTEISQGQAQRVAIARAVLHKPSIILADEPTSALDDNSCNQVIELLLTMAKDNNATLVVATHDKRLKDKIGKQLILST